MKTIVIDREIPMAVLYKAFYRNVQATSFMEEERKGYESFWHGEMHMDGSFCLSYRPIRFRRYAIRIGNSKPIPQICGNVACENGQTVIRYQANRRWQLLTLLFFAMIVIFAILNMNVGLTNTITWGIIAAFYAGAIYFKNKKLQEIWQKLIEDTKNLPKEENL